MGGLLPLGYDVDGHKLIPHKDEAKLVLRIFGLYLELGCVSKLAARLDREKVKSKMWITKRGTQFGGVSLARGHLYYLLRNRLYVGEVRHRERWYRGEHPAIVPRDLWDKVSKLDDCSRARLRCVRRLLSSLAWTFVSREFQWRTVSARLLSPPPSPEVQRKQPLFL
jgi:hypothetical protein